VQIDLTKATTAEEKQRKQITMIANTKTNQEKVSIAAALFTEWANENAAKIKMLAHLQTLTEAEKIALFKEVME